MSKKTITFSHFGEPSECDGFSRKPITKTMDFEPPHHNLTLHAHPFKMIDPSHRIKFATGFPRNPSQLTNRQHSQIVIGCWPNIFGKGHWIVTGFLENTSQF